MLRESKMPPIFKPLILTSLLLKLRLKKLRLTKSSKKLFPL